MKNIKIYKKKYKKKEDLERVSMINKWKVHEIAGGRQL